MLIYTSSLIIKIIYLFKRRTEIQHSNAVNTRCSVIEVRQESY